MATSSDIGGQSGGGRISDSIPFQDVAGLLERVSTADTNDKKKKLLDKFIGYYRKIFQQYHKTMESSKAGGDSLYPLIRVLIPDMDRGRKAYGFKSSSLGRMFAQILGLDKTSKDGKSLIEFKDPTKAGASAGDISAIIFNILQSRFSSTDESKDKLVLTDVHQILDKLARNLDADVTQDYQKKVLQDTIRKMTAMQAKWLVRLLLKDLRLGYSKTLILGLLHKQAKSLSERIGDLELLCQRLNDPSLKISVDEIVLFNHFKPMLATRMDVIDSSFDAGGSLDGASGGAQKSTSKKDVVRLPPPPFYVETKWDGERFQIHYDAGQFKYFSRRGFDFSHKFNETLTPALRPTIAPGVKSFIIDGEMMAYNKKYRIFTQKGYNIDVKTMNKDNPTHCPVFVAFDLVYYNGTVLLKTPLQQRREKLVKVFHPKEDAIRLSEVKTMNTKEQVVDCLNSAIDDGEEGLIAKDLSSTYEPAQRLVTWLKIKPEYLEDNAVDDLDLLILGAYYTESTRRGGDISHFLIGLIDKSKGKAEFFPVAKVGTGKLRSIAVKELLAELHPRLVKSPVGNVNFKGRKKPDFMIDPRKSVVVQVKASEIIPSDVYALNYTLRFPRIVKVRKDKSPGDIMTVQEFLRLREACKGKLAKRTDESGMGNRRPFYKKRKYYSDNEGSDEDRGPPRAKRPSPPLIDGQSDSDEDSTIDPLPGPSTRLLAINKDRRALLTKSPTKNSTQVTASFSTALISPKKLVEKDIFNSKIFCVYGSASWKSEMEGKIRKCGGTISQSPDIGNLFSIIGEKKSSILVEKAIRSGKYDVMHKAWVDKCIELGAETSALPTDFWGMTAGTRKQYENDYDEFGDSYTNRLSLAETKELVKRVMQQDEFDSNDKCRGKRGFSSNDSSSETGDDGNFSGAEENHSRCNSGILEELFPTPEQKNKVTWNFMNEVVAAFRGEIDVILQSKLEYYGGKVAAHEDGREVSHVIVSNRGSPSKEDHPRAFVVKQEWLEDCLRGKRIIEELRYNV